MYEFLILLRTVINVALPHVLQYINSKLINCVGEEKVYLISLVGL